MINVGSVATITRRLAAGSAVSFFALLAYFATVDNTLALLGLPGPNWLGSDYGHPISVAISITGELAIVSMAYYEAARRLKLFSGADQIRLSTFVFCNPATIAVGKGIAWSIVGTFWLDTFGSASLAATFVFWPCYWHLSILGAKQRARSYALTTAVAYWLAFLGYALIRISNIYYE